MGGEGAGAAVFEAGGEAEAVNPNTEVGGTAFAASIGRTSRREIWGSIDLIQPLRSPTSCAAKPGTAYGTSNFGIRAKGLEAGFATGVFAGGFGGRG